MGRLGAAPEPGISAAPQRGTASNLASQANSRPASGARVRTKCRRNRGASQAASGITHRPAVAVFSSRCTAEAGRRRRSMSRNGRIKSGWATLTGPPRASTATARPPLGARVRKPGPAPASRVSGPRPEWLFSPFLTGRPDCHLPLPGAGPLIAAPATPQGIRVPSPPGGRSRQERTVPNPSEHRAAKLEQTRFGPESASLASAWPRSRGLASAW